MRTAIIPLSFIGLALACFVGCSSQEEAPVAAVDESASVATTTDNKAPATNEAAKVAPPKEATAPPVAPSTTTPVASPMKPPAGSLLGSLPLPKGVTTVFANADTAIYIAPGSVDATKQECRKLLLEQGWRPYGIAGDVLFFSKDLVRLTAMISAAPAEGGKTMINFTKEPITVNLPAPDDTLLLQYSDSTKELLFDTTAKKPEMFAYYRETLAKTGWQATTERPIQIGLHDSLIFRNPAKDLLTLQVCEVEGHTRVTLRHESAEQVAEMERRMDAEIARKKAEMNKPLPKLAIALPSGAQNVQTSKKLIEFQLASGKAKAAIETLRKELTSSGWQEATNVLTNEAGSLSYQKDGQMLSVSYVDPGFIPAEVTISASGVELEKKS